MRRCRPLRPWRPWRPPLRRRCPLGSGGRPILGVRLARGRHLDHLGLAGRGRTGLSGRRRQRRACDQRLADLPDQLPGTADVQRHHQRMVGEGPEARAAHHQRTPQPALGHGQLGTQPLPALDDAGLGQGVGLVALHPLEHLHQRPAGAARLEEDIVDPIPGSTGGQRLGVDGQLPQQLVRPGTGGEAQAEVVEPRPHIGQPPGQPRPGGEALGLHAAHHRQLAIQGGHRLAQVGLGGRPVPVEAVAGKAADRRLQLPGFPGMHRGQRPRQVLGLPKHAALPTGHVV